jgi:AcrR family transcriptional regulator
MRRALKTGRSQEERNAVAKARLCQSALELFALHGYDAVTLSDIGLRAGYSRSLAQYHFSSKTQLAETLLDQQGRRHTQSRLLELPPGATGAQAWARLERHLDESWAGFRAMYGDSGSALAARGEMILSATATFSADQGLRERLRSATAPLLAQIEGTLRVCIRDGVIRPDTDAATVAIYYTSSIWGLVNVLFANRGNQEQLQSLVLILKNFMNTLRTGSTA